MSGFVLLVIVGSMLLWAWCTNRRIHHLIRYFQIEEYKTNRYFSVLWRLPQERRFIIGTVAVFIFLCVCYPISFLAVSKTGTIARVIELGWLLLLGGLPLLFLLLSPRDSEAKRPFNPTPRGKRLLYTALALAILFCAVITLILYFAHVVTDLILILPLGLLPLALSPLYLPLANLLMFPVEESRRQYYLRLAAQNLKRSGVTVIALTGSYGKTSTKHYLHHLLSSKFRTLMTPKSYNTLLGISRVINDMLADNQQYDYFIVEAGAYIPGEIARICKLVEPKIGIVTAIGPMHLERFGTIDNVVKAKYELIEALPTDGIGVFNADDPRVLGMAQRGHPNTRLLVTQQAAEDVRLNATNVQFTAEGMRFTVTDTLTSESQDIAIPLYGEHNVTNILLAMAVARQLGMTLAEIALRVATVQPAEHRLVRTILPNGVILIDDAYSANPVGTQMALRALAAQGSDQRVVVTSGMFELGALHEKENHKLGERIAEVATDAILIGETQTQPVKEGLINARFPAQHVHVVNTLEEAIAIYRGILHPTDTLLLLTDLPDTYA